MSFHDLSDRAVQVVLRIPNEDGTFDTTDCETLETETRGLVFARSADGGIGELKHRLAFVTWVVPLGESTYGLEDLWHQHPLRMNDKDETPGGLAFRDVFRAESLADSSLLFERVVQKANWRIDSWMLPLPCISASSYLDAAVARIEAHGGCAKPDPWIINWWWTFLPPETDYDPTDDISEALHRIPQAEIERAMKDDQDQLQRTDEEST